MSKRKSKKNGITILRLWHKTQVQRKGLRKNKKNVKYVFWPKRNQLLIILIFEINLWLDLNKSSTNCVNSNSLHLFASCALLWQLNGKKQYLKLEFCIFSNTFCSPSSVQALFFLRYFNTIGLLWHKMQNVVIRTSRSQIKQMLTNTECSDMAAADILKNKTQAKHYDNAVRPKQKQNKTNPKEIE